MSQRSKLPPTQQPWDDHFVAIFKCSRKPKATQVIEVANKSDIRQNQDLQRVLRVLQLGMITRHEYPNAANPTIRYATFRPSDSKAPNEARLWLNELLQVNTKAEVEKWASKLASRYIQIENVQQGVLIFLKSLLKLNGSSDGCVFVFKCDFEDISQLSPRQVFKRIEDAFEEQAKKGAQYPYFNGARFQRNVVRVFDSLGETQYWQTFLDLELQPSKTPLTVALFNELAKTRPDFVDKYSESLEALETKRQLVTDAHPVAPDDRLPPQEVERVIAALPSELSDIRIPLSLDKARVWVPIREYGRTWTLAEQFGTYYILLKGSQLELQTPIVTPFDFTHLPTLLEAVARLGGPTSYGVNIPLSLDPAKNPILRVYELLRHPNVKPVDEPGFVGFKNLQLKHITSGQAREFIHFLRRAPIGALSRCRLVFDKEWLIDFTSSSVTEWFNWRAITRQQKLCEKCQGIFTDFRSDLDAYQQGAPWPSDDIERDSLALLSEIENCKSCGSRFELEVILDKDIAVKEYFLGAPVNLKDSVNGLVWRNPESMQNAFKSFNDFCVFIRQRADKPIVIFLYEPAESYQGDFVKILFLNPSTGSIAERETELIQELNAFTAQTLDQYQVLRKKHGDEKRRGTRVDLPPSLFLQQKGSATTYPTHPAFANGPIRSVVIYAITAWLVDTTTVTGDTIQFTLWSRGSAKEEFQLVFTLKDIQQNGVSIFNAEDWPRIVGLIATEISLSVGSEEYRGYWTNQLKDHSAGDFAASQFFKTLEEIYQAFVKEKEEPERISPDLIHLLIFLNQQRSEITFRLNGGSYGYESVGQLPVGAGGSTLVKMSDLAKDRLSRILVTHPTTGKTSANSRNLQTEGVALWNNAIPQELKNAYSNFYHKDLTIYIVSDDPSFPWELVKPQQTKGKIHPTKKIVHEWWGIELNLARWLSGFAPPVEHLSLSKICCVATEKQLAAATKEVKYLQKVGAGCDLPQTRDELISLLRTKDYDLIHFACHGRFDTNQPDESVVVLPDGLPLRPGDLVAEIEIVEKFETNRPLVFLNSCHSGRTGSTILGLEGWAKELIRMNCGAFIGCGWEVDDDLAADFAITFYKTFAKRKTLAKAVKEARETIRQNDKDNSTWAAYYLFGNPNCVVN